MSKNFECYHFNLLIRSRNSSVGIATDYGLHVRGSITGRGKRFFSSPQRPDYPVDTAGPSPGGKTAGREADRSPPSSGEHTSSWRAT
jgi:hypothetical protein